MEREENGGERPLSKIYLRQGHQKGVGRCKGQELEGQSLHKSTVLDYNKNTYLMAHLYPEDTPDSNNSK